MQVDLDIIMQKIEQSMIKLYILQIIVIFIWHFVMITTKWIIALSCLSVIR